MTRKTLRLAAFSGPAVLACVGLADVPFTSTTLPTPLRPSGAAIADFNGDGLPDLAVTTDTPDKVSLLFSSSPGVLGAPVNLPTGAGTGPEDLAAADLDGDGDQDLLVILQNINTARAFINNGTGVFASGSSAAVGGNARGLASGDIDGDGDTDFGLANRDANTVTVIMNTGGVLASSSFAVGLEPRAVALARFDTDAALDLVVTNHDSANITVFRGNGAGGFINPQSYTTGPQVRPEGVAAGDLDGDGDADIAVATSDDDLSLDFVSIYTNNGTGVFTGPVNRDTLGTNPDSLVVRDLNADERADIAVVNQDSNNVSVFEGTGAGIFATPVLFAVGTRPSSITAGDIDGDGMLDLAVPNRDSNNTTILTNGTEPTAPCEADFDGNGVREVPDVFSFLNAWFAQDPRADFDGVPGLDVPDVFAFLTLWFAGC